MSEKMLSEEKVDSSQLKNPDNQNVDLNSITERVRANSQFWNVRLDLKKQNSSCEEVSFSKNSTVKKVSAFLRKLKSISEHGNIDSLCEEASKLKLSKYVSEVVSIVADLKARKREEIESILKVCTQMNVEYDEFSSELKEKLLIGIDNEFKVLSQTKKTEFEDKLKEFAKKQRHNYRITAELIFVGVFAKSELLVDLMKALIKKDKNNRYFIIPSLVANFLSKCCEECTGVMSRDMLSYYKSLNLEPKRSEQLLEKNISQELEKMFIAYFEKCNKQLLEIDKYKKEKEAENTELLKSTGNIPERNLKRLQVCYETLNKLHSVVTSMSNSLNLNPPDVKVDNVVYKDLDEIVEKLKKNITKDIKVNLFDNVETRAFYEDFIDLNIFIIKPNNAESENAEDKPSEETNTTREKAEDTPTQNTKSPVSEDHGVKPKKKLVGFPLFLEDLQNANNKTKIDAMAERFCSFNCKSNRAKLIEAILSVKKKQLANIIYYCRLVATLSKFFPELKTEINEKLEDQFFAMFLYSKQTNLTEKLKNISFIAELTKFGVYPTASVFRIFKKCNDEFSVHSIQVSCSLLEHCGRWLFKNPVTTEMCRKILKTMKEKSNSPHVDDSMKSLIEMATYQCDPPPIKKIGRKQLPNEKAFVRHLLYGYLSKDNVNTVLKLLRKMNWDDTDLVKFIRRTFFEVVSFSYEKLSLAASLIAALEKFYDFAENLVDDVLEEIRLGLEDNKVFMVQRRIAFIKFLGEMYVYRIVGSNIVFDTLYLIITFDCDKDNTKLFPSKSDESGDDFKIKLVCALLEVCGKYFKTGKLRKRLNRFLMYFQRFFLMTNLKTPVDLPVKFIIDDMFHALRPRMNRYKTLSDADQAISSMENSYSGKRHKDVLIQKQDWENMQHYFIETESEDDALDSDSSVSESEEEDGEENEDQNAEGTDLAGVDSWERKNQKSEQDLFFEKEFDNILKESIELRKYETKTITMNDALSYLQLKSSGSSESTQRSTNGAASKVNQKSTKRSEKLKKQNSGLNKTNRTIPNVANREDGEKKRLLFLSKRQADSKPQLREITKLDQSNLFVIEQENKTKKEEENKLLKETVLKRIIQGEIEKRKKGKDSDSSDSD